MDLEEFYDGGKRLKYNPTSSVAKKRGFLKSLVSFDDRFVTVVKHLEKLIAESFKGEKLKILDIGVGDAVYESLLSNETLQKCEFYGIDISKKQIIRAAKFLKEGRVVDTDKESVPYKSGEFDLVIASEILEHVFYPENILNESFRVLKSGGKILLTFPNSGALQLRLSIFFTGRSPLLNYPQNKEHIRFFNKDGILKIFKIKPKIVRYQGLSSLLFDKWNFPIKIMTPRVFEVLGNMFLPNLALGNMIILKK
jgi:ubiquinone/menaquinone biosynthesis C-methylase UbiE